LGETIGRIFEGANLRNPAPPPADFVVNSRRDPQNLEYAPFAPPDAAAAKKKTAKDFEAIGAELNRAGALNRARAAEVARPTAAGAPQPAKKSARGVDRGSKVVD
jgi:hypothetical protein